MLENWPVVSFSPANIIQAETLYAQATEHREEWQRVVELPKQELNAKGRQVERFYRTMYENKTMQSCREPGREYQHKARPPERLQRRSHITVRLALNDGGTKHIIKWLWKQLNRTDKADWRETRDQGLFAFILNIKALSEEDVKKALEKGLPKSRSSSKAPPVDPTAALFDTGGHELVRCAMRLTWQVAFNRDEKGIRMFRDVVDEDMLRSFPKAC